MAKNVYQALKNNNDSERVEMEKTGAPKQMSGWLLPFDANEYPVEELYRQGVYATTRIGMATIVNAGNEIGWERFINALNEKQRAPVAETMLKLREEWNVTGHSLTDTVNTIWTWAKGCCFDAHRTVEFTNEISDCIGDWCPQIEALEKMQMLNDEAKNVALWCDFYDDLLAHPTNSEVYNTHTHCPAMGDSHCRFLAYETKNEDESNYGKMKIRTKEEWRAKMEEKPLPDLHNQAPGKPRWLENLPDDQRLKEGVATKSRITHENMLVAIDELGFEKFLNLVADKQTWGYQVSAREMKKEFKITGTKLRDAAGLALIGYAMLCHDTHNVVEFSDERVEIVGTTCPIIESAKHMKMENAAKEMCLWCDFYHNHAVKIVNPKYNLTHTHCLGRGDDCCRIVIK